MAEEQITLSEENMTPQQYFAAVKDRKQKATDEQLSAIYDNCLDLLNKYRITGQYKGMAKLIFHLQCLEKEREIVSMGIDTFVYRDDIEFYIDKVASNVVKIIELENYLREIPDDIVSIIEKVKDKFDQLYIVFTDYTGETERKVIKERREKDPILFGTFQDPESQVLVDRFYYLGDWVDEYCDLTFDKMVNEVQAQANRNITHTIKTPADIAELKEQLNNLMEAKNKKGYIMKESPSKKTWKDRLRAYFRKKKLS